MVQCRTPILIKAGCQATLNTGPHLLRSERKKQALGLHTVVSCNCQRFMQLSTKGPVCAHTTEMGWNRYTRESGTRGCPAATQLDGGALAAVASAVSSMPVSRGSCQHLLDELGSCWSLHSRCWSEHLLDEWGGCWSLAHVCVQRRGHGVLRSEATEFQQAPFLGTLSDVTCDVAGQAGHAMGLSATCLGMA